MLGRSLPALTWLSFEVGSAGALYIASLSLLMLARAALLGFLSSRSRLLGGPYFAGAPGGSPLSAAPSSFSARLHACARLWGSGGAEPPLDATMDAWRRGVEEATPAGCLVRGRPVHFTYTDAKRIRNYLLAATPYVSMRRDFPLDFLVSVCCIGFWGGAISCWVFIGVVDEVAAAARERH